MNDWFEWNGVKCTDLGIHVEEQPPLTLASERATFTNVPGRPGSLTTLEGDDVYDDMILTANCFVTSIDNYEDIAAYLKGSGKVTFATRPEGFYYMDAVGETLGQTMGNIIAKSYDLMVELKPDAVLVLGDTNSCLSVIGAKRLHIPIFHMEAGNRCKDECLPEETNRRIVDIISDVNLAYSEHARRYLADCGLPKERTYVTGSPMAEVLHKNLAKIEASDIHARLGLTKGKYILLSAHREENIDTEKNFTSLFTAINKMAEKYDMPILYSCHPRSRKRLEQSGFQLDRRVIQHEPLGFHDYNCLQMNAFCVVSDSGTLPEESSFFTSMGHSFPAVCIRTSTERPEALDKGDFILAGIDTVSLLQAVDTAVAMNQNGDHGIPVPDYVEENVSSKVVKIIQSYTGVVNKMVWRKS